MKLLMAVIYSIFALIWFVFFAAYLVGQFQPNGALIGSALFISSMFFVIRAIEDYR